ncbi:MAG: sigma-70 family RNA polymerase sigma factor [Coriobacteriales bacterium]|jgi:RNA polymerase sigma-70 factor (ECF subfamily)|nr:sigma-70 family RNA polymerase sigma factor [Coriobacteriales bacterium]
MTSKHKKPVEETIELTIHTDDSFYTHVRGNDNPHPFELYSQVDSSAEAIVKRQENRLLRIAVAITGNKTVAEDIVQDAFVKLIEKQPHFRTTGHETAWLVKVTVNLSRSHLRSHWWNKTVGLLDDYPAANNEQRDLMQIVLSLPPKYRIVIHLYYYEGCSTREIASITNQKESTVREQMTRARRMLKVYLEGESDGILQ